MENLRQITQTTEIYINGSRVRVDHANGRLKLKVGFLGPHGTYTEEAKIKLLKDYEFSEEALRVTNGQIVQMVDSGIFDSAVVAAENSTEGDVTETQKELIRSKNTRILGETIIPINHMLIGKPNGRIEKILSHPQALGQCSQFLKEHYPQAELVQTTSTSDAVEKIKTAGNAAAIASRIASQRSEVPILKENIGDNKQNATRFYLIGRGETEPTGKDVTSLVFIPENDYVGVLRNCLDIFANNGINLSQLSSHPTGQMGVYAFRASLDGHEKDNVINSALAQLDKNYCNSLKVLGSYKKAELPEGVREPGSLNN